MSTPGDASDPQPSSGQPPHDQTQGTPGQAPYGQPGPYGQQGQYGQQPPYGYQAPYARPMVDERFWATAAHWGALLLWMFTSGVLAFLAPLVILQTKGNESPVVRRHAVASVNFQLSMLIYAAACGGTLLVGALLSFIVVGIPLLILAGVALLVVAVVSFVLPILAAVKASNGEEYAYPFTITFFS